jgi:multicomponent Na+:H+ antiporter subunit B
MNTVILQIAQRYVRGLLLLFAVVTLLRGHNHPGGGFIGGLLAGMSIVLKGFAFDAVSVRASLKISPTTYIAIGLIFLVLSFLPSFLAGEEFMKGLWLVIPLPFQNELKLGTPLVFDIGVFFTVIGVTLMFLFSLKKAE